MRECPLEQAVDELRSEEWIGIKLGSQEARVFLPGQKTACAKAQRQEAAQHAWAADTIFVQWKKRVLRKKRLQQENMGMTLGSDSQKEFKKLTYQLSQKSKRLIKADFLLSGYFWYHQKLIYYWEVCKISVLVPFKNTRWDYLFSLRSETACKAHWKYEVLFLIRESSNFLHLQLCWVNQRYDDIISCT